MKYIQIQEKLWSSSIAWYTNDFKLSVLPLFSIL
ncbi:Uncharacterised protein [Vibrio owensii]|nr:Uncharacterised protein [Vibrio owensii]